MNTETEQTLATIEVILQERLHLHIPYSSNRNFLKPYVWNSKQQGIFSPLSIIKSEGWIQEIDLETAIKNWQWPEQTGLAAQSIFDNDPYCIEDGEDEAAILLDEDTKLIRAKIYQNLFEFISNNLKTLQAFTFGCNLEDYSLSVIVGQISEDKWICICPTVPQETGAYVNDLMKCYPYNQDKNENFKLETISDIETKIKEHIEQLKDIKVYGWYDGGYNNIHNYRIIYATGNNQETALKNALCKSDLLEIYLFEKFNLEEQFHSYDQVREYEQMRDKLIHLNNFLNQTFPQLLLYRFCFWDYEHIYILGEIDNCDRVGVYVNSQFNYNP